MEIFNSLKEFKVKMAMDTQLQNKFKGDPVKAASEIQVLNPKETDVWIYRIILTALGITILAVILGVILLIASSKITDDKNVPTILTAISSAAIGALAGLIAPSPQQRRVESN